MKEYWNRIVDKELELRLEAFGATLIVGPKWCGKTKLKEHILWKLRLLRIKILIKHKKQRAFHFL